MMILIMVGLFLFFAAMFSLGFLVSMPANNPLVAVLAGVMMGVMVAAPFLIVFMI